MQRRLVELRAPPVGMNGGGSSLDNDLLRAVQAAAKFYSDSNPENTTKFDESLASLNQCVSSVDPAARLSLSQGSVAELLNYIPILLTSSTTNDITRSRLLRFLFQIAHYNVRLRRQFACEMELCGPVFECLKLSLKAQLGPQNLIDILRLLQVLTYETFTYGIWTNELVSFLLGELSRDEPLEWLPYSIAILCNLANRSNSICQRIRKSTSYKAFARRLTKLLQHDSRIVVASSLVLIGYLEEKLRELVYCPQNIAQTFQCVFNVLILGDTLMTRHIAADLLKRLVVSESPAVSSIAVVSPTGKDLINYPYFTRLVQQTAGLLVTMDARLEESSKVYEVLLAFCSLPCMRSTACTALLDTPVTEQRLTTPLMAIARTARMSFDEAIDPQVPLQALRLLDYLLREAVDSNRLLGDPLIPQERLRSIVDSTVKTPIQTGHEQVVAQCKRICGGLRLAEGMCGDDSIRSSLLEVLSAPLCAHIAETQLLSNPLVLYMGKPSEQRPVEGLPDWSAEGVAIVMELLRVLAAFKDHSKPHKDQYWRSIKDDRLVPLLAFAIARGTPSMVQDALILYTHCAQNQTFPSNMLGDMIASCGREKEYQGRSGRESANGINNGDKSSPPKEDRRKRLGVDGDRSEVNGKQLDELIGRMKQGLDLGNTKTSNLLAAYESKLTMHQIRERELEQLVAVKEAALQQTERLRLQYAAGGSFTNDADLKRIRNLVAESEQLRSEKEELEKEVERGKEDAEEGLRRLDEAKKELRDVKKEKTLLGKEVESERELSITLRKSIDEFKAKLEKMSKAVLQLQEQTATLTAELETKKDEIYKMNEERKVREKGIEQLKKEKDAFKEKLEHMQQNAEKTQQELEEKKKKMKEEMMRLAGAF